MQIESAPSALRSRAEEIRSLDTAGQKMPFLAGSWKAKVRHPEVEYVAEKFASGSITRRDLFAMGQQAVAGGSDERRRLVVGTLMWGYGERGGRSYTNARRVLTDTRLDRKLDECTAALNHGDIVGAYRATEGLSGYGSGYFTKYLYFSAREADWPDEKPRPLILDSRVEGTLNFIARVFGVSWDEKLTGGRSPSARYLHYCETVRAWATDLGLECGIGGAEKVEQYLFEPGDLWFDAYAELRRLAAAVVRDCAEQSAGMHTRAARTAMNADLAQSVS